MNFTQRFANLLIWFWTTYVLVGLNSVKQFATDAANAVDTKLTAAKSALETSISNVSTSLTTFQTSINSSISSINTSIQDLQNFATSGLVAEYLFDASGWDAAVNAYRVENMTMIPSGSKAGRYVFYLGGHQYNLTGNAEVDTIRIRLGATDYLVDYNDEVSVMYDGTAVTSVRVLSKRNISLIEEDVKALFEEYYDENPYTV